MPQRLEVEGARRLGELGHVGVQIVREPRAGLGLVERADGLQRLEQLVCALAHQISELLQHAPLFFRGDGLRDGELVAQPDERLRLHEERLAALARVVDDARQLRPVLRLHGNDVAIISQREVSIAEELFVLHVGEQILDARLELLVQPARALARRRQLRARAIRHLARRLERGVDAPRQRREIDELFAELRQPRHATRHVLEKIARARERGHHVRELHQLRPLERGALARAIHEPAHVARARQREHPLLAGQEPRFFNQCQRLADVVDVRVQRPAQGTRVAQIGPCAASERLQQPREAEVQERLASGVDEL